jgi:hypothetical protein
MEDSSHSVEFIKDKKLLSQSGMAVRGGHNCSGREQTPESGIQIPGLAFWPSARLMMAGVKNGGAGFVAEKILCLSGFPA